MSKTEVLGYLSTEILNSAISKLETSGILDGQSSDLSIRQAIAESLPRLARNSGIADCGIGAQSILVSNAPEELVFSLVTCYGNLQQGVLTDAGARCSALTYGQILNRPVDSVPRDEGMHFDEDAFLSKAHECNPAIIFLANPSDPCADIPSPAFIKRLVEQSDALLVIDETSAEFSNRTYLELAAKEEKVCVLRSLTNARPVADFQIAYAVSSENIASKVRADLTYHLVDAITQSIGIEICENISKFEAYIKSTHARRTYLCERLRCLMGCTVHPTASDFILIEVSDANRARQILARDHAISLEDISDSCDSGRFMKIPVGSDDDNSKMLDALTDCLMQGC